MPYDRVGLGVFDAVESVHGSDKGQGESVSVAPGELCCFWELEVRSIGARRYVYIYR